MMESRLHIVCLDVPYPPDYGGAVDMFYKIRYLAELNIRIVLHCFEYGRGEQPELEKYCEQVFYYKRKKTFPIGLPYIVSSRKNRLLLQRLRADNNPILLEGIHCTYPLFKGELHGREVFVRLHNVEHAYYRKLAGTTNNLFKKLYFRWESILLKKYEKQLVILTPFLCLSKQDVQRYRSMGAQSAHYLPLFIRSQPVSSLQGKGSYCLYHGNLSVPENENACVFLIEHVFSKTHSKLIIAGKNPSQTLKDLCKARHIEIICNPGEPEMESLIRDAQIHVLPSMNETGIKVKLVNALFKGRFVLVNQNAFDSPALASLCIVANQPEEFVFQIEKHIDQEFSLQEIQKRKEVLMSEFDPEQNARKLIRMIFN